MYFPPADSNLQFLTGKLNKLGQLAANARHIKIFLVTTWQANPPARNAHARLLLQSTTIKAVASGVATRVLANDGFPAEQVAAAAAALLNLPPSV